MESASLIKANELFGEDLEFFTKDYDRKLEEIRKAYQDFFKTEEVKDKVFDFSNLYGAFSVDILLDSNGVTKPVDINFFPAGARNYDYEALFLLAKELSTYKGRILVMLVENAGSISTNPEYYKSLFVYHLASELAEVELNFRTLGQSNIQKYKEDELSAGVVATNKEEESFRKLQKQPFIQEILDKLKIDQFVPKHYTREFTTIIPNTDGSSYADGVNLQFVTEVLNEYQVLNAFPASGWQSRGKHLGLNLYNQILKQELKEQDPVAYQNHKLIVNKTPFNIEVENNGRVLVNQELTKNISSVIIKEIKSRLKKDKDIDLDKDQIVTIFLKTNSATHGKVPTFGQGILPISFEMSADAFQDIKHGIEDKNPLNISILNEDEEEQKSFTNSKHISNEYYTKAEKDIEDIVTQRLHKAKNTKVSKGGYHALSFKAAFETGTTEVIAMAGIQNEKEFVYNIFGKERIATFERKDNSGNQGKNSLSYQGEPTNKNNPDQSFAFVSSDLKEKLHNSIAANIVLKAIHQEVEIYSKISFADLIEQDAIKQDKNSLQMSKPTSQQVLKTKPGEKTMKHLSRS
jgi:hypothetical protein